MKLVIDINDDDNDINTTQIYTGNAVYVMEGKSYKLLGIIESSYYEDDIYIIQLIPSYIIINWIIKDELANTVYNLYVDIDDNNMINNNHN